MLKGNKREGGEGGMGKIARPKVHGCAKNKRRKRRREVAWYRSGGGKTKLELGAA